MAARAFITGLAGPALTADERGFLREARPWGLILFRRNIEDKAQVTRLVAEVLQIIGQGAAVLVDQEGGRVQRLGPPHWPAYPAGATYGRLYDRDPALGLAAARLGARLIASDLVPLGINVDCLPLADVPVAGADAVIGDRAYGETPAKVAAIAGAIAEGLQAGGVLPVLKHIPGHGRSTADSHQHLPVVDADRATLEASDFAAFRPLKNLPLAMTAHVVFTALDPVLPATTSVTMIRDVIRGFIGFDGLLMTDDISMGALSGSIAERTRAALAAGCDLVLHCNGRLDEMQAGGGRSAGACRCGRAARGCRARRTKARKRPGRGRGLARVCRHDGGADRLMSDQLAFESELAERASDEPALVVDVEGFEGPLDLLLTLARQQKVDLAKISVLALAEQYLAFIEAARQLRLELAADYLVMAAWLAYLKSRLLLPEAAGPEEQSAEDMANALAWRLKRLEAFRTLAGKLMERPQLQRDVFQRGDPEPIADIKHPQWTATLYDLLSAYAQQRQRSALSHVRFKQRTVWSLVEAREALERLIGQAGDWSRLDEYLINYLVEPAMRATVFASSLAATLELIREGVVEVHQHAAFAPIYLRKRDSGGLEASSGAVMPRATE